MPKLRQGPYLRCAYYTDGPTFSNEYLIKFNGVKKPQGCIVSREDVAPLTSDIGLAKLVLLEPQEDGTLVIGLNNTADQSISRFHVKKDEIVNVFGK